MPMTENRDHMHAQDRRDIKTRHHIKVSEHSQSSYLSFLWCAISLPS